MDAIWERWDLVCDPAGCEPLDQVLRAMVYGFVVIGLMIFYAAARPWTTDLPPPLGAAASTVAAIVLTWIAVAVAASSPRVVIAMVVLALLAVWIGRPDVTRGSSARSGAGTELNEDASPTSSMR